MRILGIDYGDVRTGFAISDKTGLIASPVETFTSKSREKVSERAIFHCADLGAEKIILGLPLNMNNSLGPRAEKTMVLRDLITSMSQIPVELWDERSTTVLATKVLNETDRRGKKRKAAIDQLAAVLILQNYLDFGRGSLSK